MCVCVCVCGVGVDFSVYVCESVCFFLLALDSISCYIAQFKTGLALAQGFPTDGRNKHNEFFNVSQWSFGVFVDGGLWGT